MFYSMHDNSHDLFISIDSKDTDTVVYDVLTQNSLQEFFNSKLQTIDNMTKEEKLIRNAIAR